MPEAGLEPKIASLVNKHSTIEPNWPNDWAVSWVLTSTVHLTVCSYHVKYAFQSESTLYNCMNIKELLARNRYYIWSLSDCSRTRTYNHLVRKWTLNNLVKWPNDWAVLRVLIFTVHLTVCSYHVTYVFQSESTLYRVFGYMVKWLSVWRSGWVLVYELSGCRFESCCAI